MRRESDERISYNGNNTFIDRSCRLRRVRVAEVLQTLVGTAQGEGESLPSYPIQDVSNTRALVGGQRAKTMTSARILQNVQSRASSAGILQMSDLSVVVNTNDGLIGTDGSTVTCAGVTCTFSLAEGVPASAFSLNGRGAYPIFTTEDTNLEGFNTESSAVMIDNRITITQGRGAARQDMGSIDYRAYGGWISSSIFGVESLTVTPESSEPVTWFGGYSFGNDSGSNPASGATTWNGVMIGVTDDGGVVHGDAMIDIDNPASPDVAFANVMNFDTRRAVSDITWTGLTVTDGIFSAADGFIEGVFYGTSHNEVGGIFGQDDIVYE